MTASVGYSFSYADESAFLVEQNKLRLAGAYSQENRNPALLKGTIDNAKVFTDMLLALSTVVRTNYLFPSPAFIDPVITCHDDKIRFEGFSTCCGVYARIDADTGYFSPEKINKGTTNVDFSDNTRAALSQFRMQRRASVDIGSDSFAMDLSGEKIFEKKVELPQRWVKGFSEVQVYLSQLKKCAEFKLAQCRSFFLSLPRSANQKAGDGYANWSGGSLRLTQLPKNSIKIAGLHRLSIIPRILLKNLKKLEIFYDELSCVSAWVVHTENMTFNLVLSPAVNRGFSGEGQILELLLNNDLELEKAHVEAALKWQSRIFHEDIAQKNNFSSEKILQALTLFGGQGLVGYDLQSSSFFHRALPFAEKDIGKNQPRLKNARKLVEKNKVRATISANIFAVESSEMHRVSMTDKATCTCYWYRKHSLSRGPCKHILAVKIFLNKG